MTTPRISRNYRAWLDLAAWAGLVVTCLAVLAITPVQHAFLGFLAIGSGFCISLGVFLNRQRITQLRAYALAHAPLPSHGGAGAALQADWHRLPGTPDSAVAMLFDELPIALIQIGDADLQPAPLRRTQQPAETDTVQPVLGFVPGILGLQLDPGGYRATLNGTDLQLTAVEFTLLAHLAEHPGRIYSRSQLMDAIYADHRVVTDRTIDSHVKKLRKKIAAVAVGQELIHSVYGVGYKFERN